MGDTFCWSNGRTRSDPMAVPQSHQYYTASQEDIIERGLLNLGPNEPGDRLVALDRIAQETPTQLENAIENIKHY